MKNKIYKKFLLSFLAFAIISAAIILSLGANSIYRHLTKQKASSLKKIASRLCVDLLLSGHEEFELNYFTGRLGEISEYENVEIWIVGSQGEVIYTSNPSGTIKEGTILKNVYPYKAGSYYSIGDFDKIFSEDKLTVIHPVIQGYRTAGYIVLHYDYYSITSEGDGVLHVFFIIVGMILFAALVIFGILSLSIIRPINRINKAVKEYAAGNLGHIVEVNSNDEIGLLAAALNDMSSELEKTEEYQKRLIANVSHDFRSPLTSIKGYIEAILDGTIPSELQEKYLNIILKESKRLSGLTEELLELNKVDSNKIHLDLETVNIHSLIRDTVASFEQRCVQRNITVELLFENEDSYVLADKSKIQQVLYNLLDNAIKFSSNDSDIIIETTTNKEKIMISVKDQGCGIAAEELKNIWERFYKSDLSRGRDKYSSGLGLSIVKEIIQLHNENINVVSTQNAGTTFIFTLRLIEE